MFLIYLTKQNQTVARMDWLYHQGDYIATGIIAWRGQPILLIVRVSQADIVLLLIFHLEFDIYILVYYYVLIQIEELLRIF